MARYRVTFYVEADDLPCALEQAELYLNTGKRLVSCRVEPYGFTETDHQVDHRSLATAPVLPEDDNEPPDCRKCKQPFTINGGFERCAHGMCWSCASEVLDQVFELIKE